MKKLDYVEPKAYMSKEMAKILSGGGTKKKTTTAKKKTGAKGM